jgi:hypothetical protein
LRKSRLAGHNGKTVSATKAVKGAQRAAGRTLDGCGSGHDRFPKQTVRRSLTGTHVRLRFQSDLDIRSLDRLVAENTNCLRPADAGIRLRLSLHHDLNIKRRSKSTVEGRESFVAGPVVFP